MTEQFLDSVPICGVYLLLFGVGIAVFEIGFRIGRWYQRRTPDEKEGITGTLVGSMLGLLALLLAFTVGISESRFDTRRGLVMSEANAIGTTYLRAGYLPEPYHTEIRDLLREYVPLQIFTKNPLTLTTEIERSAALQDEIWARTETLARENPNSETVALFIETVNEMIDLHAERVMASVYARVPDTLLLMLVFGGTLTVALIGYNAGLTGNRSLLGAVLVIIIMAAVITIVFDLDRPRDGLVRVSQKPYEDLITEFSEPE